MIPRRPGDFQHNDDIYEEMCEYLTAIVPNLAILIVLGFAHTNFKFLKWKLNQ